MALRAFCSSFHQHTCKDSKKKTYKSLIQYLSGTVPSDSIASSIRMTSADAWMSIALLIPRFSKVRSRRSFLFGRNQEKYFT